MNSFHFYKYQGTGNDFILFDGINAQPPILSSKIIAHLCHRRIGIGADGLMIILPSEHADFKMQYFNSDGEESTMCGNGGRCIAHLAHKLSLTSDVVSFEAIDGLHTAIIEGDMVKLGMNDVSKIKINEQNDYVLNTGSPHYVHFCNSNELNHIVSFGKQIRYNEEYKKEGINVNMVNTIDEQSIEVATYERGVEDETYSCGTGVTAAAIAYSKANNKSSPIYIKTKGGDLIVHFDIEDNTYINVILEGPATYVFEGQVTI